MPFYEIDLLLGDIQLEKPRHVRINPEEPIELPPYRNGNQRQLRFHNEERASIVEINVSQGVFTTHADLRREEFNMSGPVVTEKDAFVTTVILWSAT